MAKQGQEFQPVVQATPVSATTIAIAQAYPVVVQTFIDSLSGYDRFLVKQDASLLEMATSNAGFGCCEAANKYAIYGSEQSDANGKQTPLLLAQEESQCLGRGCCAPNHAFKMKFYQPRYGTGGKQADKDKGALWTMERDGCCSKWLNCCPPVHACCQQSMTLYAGDVEGEIGSMTGQVIGRAEQPKPFGGCCTPTLHSEFFFFIKFWKVCFFFFSDTKISDLMLLSMLFFFFVPPPPPPPPPPPQSWREMPPNLVPSWKDP